MNVKLAIGLVLGGLLMGGVTETATAAQGLYYGSHYGYGYGYPLAYPLRRYHVQRTPPYFALFPPVYYSSPVKRPYGLSPYAWPPVYHGSISGDTSAGGRQDYAAEEVIKRSEPKRTPNPYVSGPAEAAPNRAQAQRRPLRIHNPFVDRQGGLAVTPATMLSR